MRILALEPYNGGSHRAFLEGWSSGSRHAWTVLALPPFAWKWRMRHAAVTFARQIRGATGGPWDALICTSMLDLATFRGLAPRDVSRLPAVLYFHENQLTYPSRRPDERDLHFAYTHFTSCLAADEVWFNSAYHHDTFLDALEGWLRRMPDHGHAERIEEIRRRSSVQAPGCDVPEEPSGRPAGRPLTILWAARWEHDKNPEDFFEACRRLDAEGQPFRLHVLGERFRDEPAVFAEAAASLRDHIVTWGYRESRAEYLEVLADADVVVSTARHEFFGLAVAEAVLAGCRPLLPDRLAYPELLGGRREFFYDGSLDGLTARLSGLAVNPPPPVAADLRGELAARFGWPARRPALDAALEETGP
jgi:glycosyltransferase involved in cell wall biosynthesis